MLPRGAPFVARRTFRCAAHLSLRAAGRAILRGDRLNGGRASRCRRGLSGPKSQSHRITAVIVMLVIFLVMPVIFVVMLVIGSMNCGIVLV